MPRVLNVTSALAFGLLLTACGSVKELLPGKSEYRLLAPPEALLSCPDEPRVPAAEDKPVGLFILELAEAGEACRAQLRAVDEWVKKEKAGAR